MEVKYQTTVENDILRIRLFTVNTTVEDAQICVNQTIKTEDFRKAGNLIDRKTLPFRICYILLKGFQEKLCQELLKYNDYIFDDNLKNNIVEYTKDIMQDKIEIMPAETFRQLLEEVEKFSESI